VGGPTAGSEHAIPFSAPIRIDLELETLETLRNLFLDIKVVSREGVELSLSQSNWLGKGYLELPLGRHRVTAEIENTFQPGQYYLTIGAHHSDGATLAYIENIVAFEVLDVSMGEGAGYEQHWRHGYFRPNTDWTIQNS
jgi:hypothetical protein